MKGKLTALLLVLAMLLSSCLLGACGLLAPDGTEEPKEPDAPGDLEPPEEPYTPPLSDYDPNDWFTGDPEPTFEQTLEQTLAAALAKINYAIGTYDGKFPRAYSKDLVYTSATNANGWTQGFWVGVLWQAYELSGKTKYSELATAHVDSFYTRINEKLGVDNHDMGFLYIPSCVAAYELTGNETAKTAALMAADQLLTRYHADAGFIQAWGTMGDSAEYRLIIDCMMNVPLLYWASEETGDPKYAEAATNHVNATVSTIFRADGSTYHTYYFDPETKLPSHGATKQGYSDESAWSRGQSWAVYGTALAYGYTRDPELLAKFKIATDYFLSHLPEDNVPYWDFDRSGVEGEPRDTSAAAITVCGILEGCQYLELTDPDRARYLAAAEKMMKALIDNYFTGSRTVFNANPTANGLLTGVTQSRMSNSGVDEMTPYGDYYFMEALNRFICLKNGTAWDPYW